MMWLLPNMLVGLQGKTLKSDNHVNGIDSLRDKVAEYTLVFPVKNSKPEAHKTIC